MVIVLTVVGTILSPVLPAVQAALVGIPRPQEFLLSMPTPPATAAVSAALKRVLDLQVRCQQASTVYTFGRKDQQTK